MVIGLGIGAYEGATDALLFDLHGNRASPYVNINHLCVTLGGALIALYVISSICSGAAPWCRPGWLWR